MLFKTADPKSLPKQAHWGLGTDRTSCRALRLPSWETRSCGLSPGGWTSTRGAGRRKRSSPSFLQVTGTSPGLAPSADRSGIDLPGSRVVTDQAFPTLRLLELLTWALPPLQDRCYPRTHCLVREGPLSSESQGTCRSGHCRHRVTQGTGRPDPRGGRIGEAGCHEKTVETHANTTYPFQLREEQIRGG